MKAKFVKPLYKPKTDEKEIIFKVDDLVDFSINDKKRAILKLNGKDIDMPFKPFFEKVVFTKTTKAELISLNLITEDGKIVEEEPAKEQQVENKQPDTQAAQQKSGAAATKQELASGGAHGGLIGAIVNLNTICKGELLSLHVTKISEESVDLNLLFFSSKFPAVTATIDAADFGTNKLELEIAQFMDEHSQTISNKLEILANLDEQIKARQEELKKTPAATTSTVKGGGKKGGTTAKAEKVKEEAAIEFEEPEAEAEGDGEDGDFEEPNVVDSNEFEE